MEFRPIIYNTKMDDYFLSINSSINNCIKNDFNLYNTNFNLSYDYTSNIVNNPYLKNFINNVQTYYNDWTNNQNLFDPAFMDKFLVQITIDDYINIYTDYISTVNHFNINDFVMKNLFIYSSTNMYGQSFLDFNYYANIDGTSKLTNFIAQKNYLFFIFIINSPIYRIYFLYTYFAHLSLDPYYKQYLNNDIENIRDFTLNFITEYILFFNNINIANYEYVYKDGNVYKFYYTFNKYNFTLLRNNKYNLINNFICYDKINIFTNSYFLYLLYESYNNNFMFLYNSNYFCQSVNTDNFIDSYKYNYDDVIIILYLNCLKANSNFFNNFTLIYEFANLFFNKTSFDFTKINALTIKLLENNNSTNTVNISVLNNDPFYYNCCYTSYSLGCTFDNNNAVIISSINSIFNETLIYNNFDEKFKNFYFIKTFDVKQYENYLETNNLTDGFKYINTFFNTLFYLKNNSSYRYYNQLLNSIYYYISILTLNLLIEQIRLFQ
jgi:hypothetical protein